jgi:pimeloyl-ACP methyl ester carboxylesterase
MGGMVAQELALRHPERVRTLVLASTFAGGESALGTYPPAVQALVRPLLRSGRPPDALAALVADQARRWGVARDDAGLRTVLTQLAAVGGHDTLARLPQIRVPTLVVHGERDPAVPVANARILAGAIPGARLEVLAGAGHVPFWQQPERLARLVAEHALAGG